VNFGEKSNTPPVVYYVLTDPALKDADPQRAAPEDACPTRGDATLLVLDTATSGFYDTDHLVFSRSAGPAASTSSRAGPSGPASASPI
jgi:cholesterol transport system auxiliary component